MTVMSGPVKGNRFPLRGESMKKLDIEFSAPLHVQPVATTEPTHFSSCSFLFKEHSDFRTGHDYRVRDVFKKERKKKKGLIF